MASLPRLATGSEYLLALWFVVSMKDLAGRIVLQPFRSTRTPTGRLNGLGFHMGGSVGRQVGPLPSFRTSVGQTYFSYAPGTTANGRRTRVSPAIFYYYRALGVFGEYMRSAQAVTKPGVTQDVSNHAWEITGSLVLTGEAATDRGVRPKNDFDPPNGHWGALQILGRYTTLTVDRDVFTTSLAAAGASRDAQSYTIAANWYPSAFIRYYARFERTVFDRDPDGPRPAENVILFRTQLSF